MIQITKYCGQKVGILGFGATGVSAAESLSKYAAGELSLNGLTSLSDTAAESLTKYEGSLVLELDTLPDSAAKILRDAGHG